MSTSLSNFSLSYQTRQGPLLCLDALDLELPSGQVTALVGESGSGKSTLARALLGLLPSNAVIHPGSSCQVEGADLLKLAPEELRRFRWVKASMVFQAAQTALNPLRPIGQTFQDVARAHPDARPIAVDELLREVQLDPDRVLPSYPHQLSGGMKQRVVIALALLLDPPFVVLDEPTTALDLLTQATVFSLLRGVQARRQTTMLFITHDLSAVAQLAHRVVVLYAGRLVEEGPVEAIFANPQHPYTVELVASAPRLDRPGARPQRKFHPPSAGYRSPAGCVFAASCPRADAHCAANRPPLTAGPSTSFACFHPEAECRSSS
ncbi:MAG: ABC transporter ATP-binding protein [Vulcanimicrobiota bacterium]